MNMLLRDTTISELADMFAGQQLFGEAPQQPLTLAARRILAISQKSAE